MSKMTYIGHPDIKYLGVFFLSKKLPWKLKPRRALGEPRNFHREIGTGYFPPGIKLINLFFCHILKKQGGKKNENNKSQRKI